MPVSRDTLKAMIQEYGGIPLSDEELDLVSLRWTPTSGKVAQLRDLDLSSVMSGRLMRVQEGEQGTEGGSNA